ncbi:hypothetical protein AAG570_009994 [Ranatra chinensis]|uniref:Uncharacterized protein n=1 Tax=Ranatra chinensis TaxID=642074 RepID=A0ABD0YRB2_9HEMI
MASKRRNMFQKNKTQETTENGRGNPGRNEYTASFETIRVLIPVTEKIISKCATILFFKRLKHKPWLSTRVLAVGGAMRVLGDACPDVSVKLTRTLVQSQPQISLTKNTQNKPPSKRP